VFEKVCIRRIVLALVGNVFFNGAGLAAAEMFHGRGEVEFGGGEVFCAASAVVDGLVAFPGLACIRELDYSKPIKYIFTSTNISYKEKTYLLMHGCFWVELWSLNEL
jgi:hypothetical protein